MNKKLTKKTHKKSVLLFHQHLLPVLQMLFLDLDLALHVQETDLRQRKSSLKKRSWQFHEISSRFAGIFITIFCCFNGFWGAFHGCFQWWFIGGFSASYLAAFHAFHSSFTLWHAASTVVHEHPRVSSPASISNARMSDSNWSSLKTVELGSRWAAGFLGPLQKIKRSKIGVEVLLTEENHKCSLLSESKKTCFHVTWVEVLVLFRKDERMLKNEVTPESPDLVCLIFYRKQFKTKQIPGRSNAPET